MWRSFEGDAFFILNCKANEFERFEAGIENSACVYLVQYLVITYPWARSLSTAACSDVVCRIALTKSQLVTSGNKACRRDSAETLTSVSLRFLFPPLLPTTSSASTDSCKDTCGVLARACCWFRTMYGKIVRLARLRRDVLPREVNLRRTTTKTMLPIITRT